MFHYVAAEDDYYHWWMEHGAQQWRTSHPMIGKYHLCKEEASTCQAKAKWARVHPDGVVLIDDMGSFAGAGYAVDEYRSKHGITSPIYKLHELKLGVEWPFRRYEAAFWRK